VRYAFLLLCCLSLLVPYGCSRYEQENDRLKEEIKMLREQNDYAQAEIVGLKKELAELDARMKDEREALQKRLDEERGQMQKTIEEIRRETAQKKAETDKKNGGPAKKAPIESDVSKKTPGPVAGAAKKGSSEKNARSGENKTKETGAKPGAQKSGAGKTPTGGTPDEE